MPKKQTKKTSKIGRLTTNYSHLRLLNFLLVFGLAGTLYLLFVSAATVTGPYGSFERDQFDRTNAYRASKGLGSLVYSDCVLRLADAHARAMATDGKIYHSGDNEKDGYMDADDRVRGQQIFESYCGTSYTLGGENVGTGGTSESIFNAYVASAGHEANIRGSFNRVGIAAYKGIDGRYYTSSNFINCNCTSAAAFRGDPVAPFDGSGSLGKTVGYTEYFVRGTDNQLYRNYYHNGWSGWRSLGGQITTSPAWVSWGPDRADVFARGTDGKLYHRYATRTGWSNWQSLGGSLTSAPAVTSWSSGVLHVFARGTDNAIWYRSCGSASQCNDANQWAPWKSIGGVATSSPTAASMGVNNLNVFVTGTDQKIYNSHWSGAQWGSWHAIPVSHKVQAKTAPAAVSMGANSVNVFVQGTDDSLYNMWWDGYRWNGPQHLGGTLAGRLNAVTWGGNRIDLYVRGTDGAGYHKLWDGRNWLPPAPQLYEPLGGQISNGTDLY